MNDNLPSDEHQLETLARRLETGEAGGPPAPSYLKAHIYSALVRRQQESGPLLSLAETKLAARGLCVFEKLVQILPLGEKAKSFNCCGVCHARVLAEKMENAPIYWDNCPYVGFQKA